MNWGVVAAWIGGAAGAVWALLTTRAFWVGASVLAALLWLWSKARRRTVTLSLPGFGSLTFDLSDSDRTFAWKLHVQLVTRKAALPFDETADVIAEVFDSLFDLFRVTREMLLELPPSDHNDGRPVANLAIRVLNDAVRPRLTRWQAVHRRWWEHALADTANALRTPQEIQRDFPSYEQLVADIRAMNTELSTFAGELAALAAGRRAVKRSRRRRPLQPSTTVSPTLREPVSLPPVAPPGASGTQHNMA